jgi:hypothetical protein
LYSGVIFGVEHGTGKEAQIGVHILGRLVPHLPGAKGLVWDGALRGTHLDQLMEQHGLLTINPITAPTGGRVAS